MTDFASVCVLSFNRPEFLDESLRSLAAQTYPIEIVVGDDGSSPDVQEWVIEQYRLGRMSSLFLRPPGENQGVGAMTNALFNIAGGSVLVKSDQDLLYEPGAIAEFVRVLGENAAREVEPTIGTLGGFRYEHDPVDHRKMLKAHHESWDEVEDYVSSAMAVPRGVWVRSGPWEEHSAAFAEDVMWKLKLTEAGYVHGLTRQDVIRNVGFGPPHSTVVRNEKTDDGQWVVQPIHHEPKIFRAA
jgi:glycosyltransferase involved in cell wall biosynthesis